MSLSSVFSFTFFVVRRVLVGAVCCAAAPLWIPILILGALGDALMELWQEWRAGR